MGKKSRKKPPAPLPLPCDRCAKRVPATVARRCPKCELAVYCSKECQRAAWSGGHRGQCEVMKRADILEKAGHPSLYFAAGRGDMAAVRALNEAGADVEEVDEEHDCTTPIYGAAQGGHLAIMVYLVEECGASLRHVANLGFTVMHEAALPGRLDVVRYVAKKAPELIDMPDKKNVTPIMTAACHGRIPVVRHLARLGCSLSHKDDYGFTALDYARYHNRHPDTARLLSDIDSAGGWRPYARMAYVRIRHEVSKTYAVLDEGHDDRALLHLVFGRNRAAVDAAAPSHGERLEEAAEDGSEKPKAMLELPDVVFRLVCRFLE
jgi:hypothetical protein